MRQLFAATMFAGTLLASAGCSGEGPHVLVNGKLTNNGKTVLTDRVRGGVILTFMSQLDASKRFTGIFNTEIDTYYVYGPTGKGIPAGKYRVAVHVTAPNKPRDLDKLNEKFNEANTPIEFEVTRPVIDIDLAKYP